MRDANIVAMHQANAKRNAMVLGQFEFIETRSLALENVIKVSKFADRLRWLIKPSLFFMAVDAVQMALLEHRKEEYAKAQTRAKLVAV